MRLNPVNAFVALEKQLQTSLERSRSLFDHSGLKGSLAEESVRDFLSGHLPRHLNVGHGEAIDRQEHRSGQLDLVISNGDQPFIFPPEQAGLFLVEGMAAAGEVKTKLTTGELDDVISKGYRYRALRVSHLQGDMIHVSAGEAEWFYTSPPFFAVALESNVRHTTIIARLSEQRLITPSAGQLGASMPPVDAIFVLGQGAAVYFHPSAPLKYRVDDGGNLDGWRWLPQPVLASLLAWLHVSMPRTVRFKSVLTPYLVGGVNSQGELHEPTWNLNRGVTDDTDD